MVSISTNEFRNGIALIIDGNLMELQEFQFVKPGKGGAFVRTRLKNMKTGQVLEKTFDSRDKVELAHIEKLSWEFLYREGENFVFMDTESFDQHIVTPATVQPLLPYLKENTVCSVKMHDGEIITCSLPDFVILAVVEAEPWIKGSMAQGSSKPVVLETGATIQAPVFVNAGEKIRIDTRTGRYVERA
ncbi:MAG: elongation factor P [Planctomycetota bacterium]